MRPLGPNDRNRWRADAEGADLVRPERSARPAWIEAAPKRLRLDLARTAILVIDFQNDFCHPEGWLAGVGADVSAGAGAVAATSRLLPALRAAGVPVVWVNWGNRADLANVPPGVMHVYDGAAEGRGLGAPIGPGGARVLTAGSWSAAVVEGLEIAEGDLRVDKFRMSGFPDTALDSILRNLRVDTLLFAGVNADQCVLHTLADAACLGYDVVLLEDASATTSPAFCMEATLYNVRQIYGFTATTAAVLDGLKEAEA